MRPLRLLPLSLSLSAHALVAAALWVRGAHVTSPPLPGSGIIGDSFALPAPELADGLGLVPPSMADVPKPAAEDGVLPAPKAPVPTETRRPARAPALSASASSIQAGSASLYGALGDRSAVDLATAFTRGFPHAASEDAAWRTAPLGNAGEADVFLILDESGHLESSRLDGATSPALTSGIRRTLALVAGRTFTARGKKTRLRVSATISSDSVHDGLHGDVFAIGGSFAADEGRAFFALAIGRRIDIRVRVR